jgi:hypothetical protein
MIERRSTSCVSGRNDMIVEEDSIDAIDCKAREIAVLSFSKVSFFIEAKELFATNLCCALFNLIP